MAYLYAAIVWSAVGLGFFVYGRRRRHIIPVIGGVILMSLSGIVNTTLLLSLASAGIAILIYMLDKRF